MKLFLEIIEKKDLKEMGGSPPTMLRVEITDDEDGRAKLAELREDKANADLFAGEHVIRVHECREGAPCSIRSLANTGIASRNSDSTADETTTRLDALEQSVLVMYQKQTEAVKLLNIAPATLSDSLMEKTAVKEYDIQKTVLY